MLFLELHWFFVERFSSYSEELSWVRSTVGIQYAPSTGVDFSLKQFKLFGEDARPGRIGRTLCKDRSPVTHAIFLIQLVGKFMHRHIFSVSKIQGTPLGLVPGPGACGIDQAVRIRSVAGVSLRPNATIDCRTASALKTWVERGVLPAVGGEGGGAASLRVVSHYACRTRNNQAGARLSEHSFGRAIDIAGIGLRDGSEMTLLTDWNSRSNGAQLKQMWRAACGPFGTVLGPGANRFHRDHFHFDTARYRSGSYCR